MRLLNCFWSDLRLGLAGAAALPVVAGLVSAWLTPRGPVTTSQALISMGLALLVGIGAGLLSGSRWSMLVAPAVFAVVFELGRLGIAGPTVDAIHLGSAYGIIAFIVGRFFHGVLVLAPMALGASYGIRLAARFGIERPVGMGIVGWTFTGIITLALIALGISLARPAATSPIPGADGEPLPGSIAEIINVPIGGRDQTMMIRGKSVDNPILLYLAGGPGGTDLGAMRADTSLEQHFIVVTWEQRGAGKSYSAL
ncbi:MAG: hypothetical protein JXA42_23340, partial [Anaerolineales bacterium]|nr:hypothetical protein [Anaerolineales bacterium]